MWNLEKYRDLFLESFGEDRRGMNTYKSLLKGFDFDDIRNWTDNTYIIKEFEQVHPKSTIVRAEMLKQNYPYDLAVLKMYVKDNLSDFKN